MSHLYVIIVSEVTVPPATEASPKQRLAAWQSAISLQAPFCEDDLFTDYCEDDLPAEYFHPDGSADLDYYHRNYPAPYPRWDSYECGEGPLHGWFQAITGQAQPPPARTEAELAIANSIVVRDLLEHTAQPVFRPNVVILPDGSAWPDTPYVELIHRDLSAKISQGFFRDMLAPYASHIALVSNWHW